MESELNSKSIFSGRIWSRSWGHLKFVDSTALHSCDDGEESIILVFREAGADSFTRRALVYRTTFISCKLTQKLSEA